MTTSPLLDVRGLHIAFAGQAVVQGLDLQIRPGEKLALVGESGSGKSITALALLGLLADAHVGGQAGFRPDPAQPARDLLRLSPRELRGVRGREIAMVFQEPMTAFNPLLTLGQQIAEVLELHLALTPAQAAARAVELLAETGIPEPERRARAYPHQLSGGQRQRAMIAMALAGQPRLLLADEPTTALDVSLRGQMLDLLAQAQARHGMAVLLITHDLPLVRRFADRVAVMERGQLVETGTVAQVFADPRHPYTRRLLGSEPERDVPPRLPDGATGPAPLIQARGLRVGYPVPRPGWRGWWRKDQFIAVQGADFALRPGQTLGVIGESGSGKSTLALAVLGLLPAQGELRIQGQVWQGQPKADRPLRRVVQVVFQDPFSSLSPRMTVEDIVGEGLRVHQPELDAAQRQTRVLASLQEVGLNPAQFPGLLGRYPHEFSGGQRQRIALARALIVEPQVLVLDEPTSALDVTIQKQVLQLLQTLQRERGLSYLLITHDMAVIRALAHDVLVMQAAQVVEAGPVDQVLGAPRHPYTRRLLAATLSVFPDGNPAAGVGKA